MREPLGKKSLGFYLSIPVAVLMLVQWVMYLAGVADLRHPVVAICMPAAVVLYVINAIHPVRYLEYVPMILGMAAVFVYFTTEASYISVCYLAVDDMFTAAYLAHIFMTVAIGVLCILPPIFKQEI